MLSEKDLTNIYNDFRQGDEEKYIISKISRTLISKIEAYNLERKLDAEVMLVGSAARGTSLKGGDVDIFIVFDRKYSRDQIVNHGLSIGHRVLPEGNEKYAEHPYVTGFVEKHKVDIVPCFKMNKDQKIMSSVDRTPLHTQFMIKHLNDVMRREIILLKSFMKGVHVYGSEVYRSGFSGYVCELLVLKLGGFDKVLEFFASNTKRLVLGEVTDGKRFETDSLIIVDPTDSSRNAAASVSGENLARMRILSREFVKNPEKGFFYGMKDDYTPRMDRGTRFVVATLPKPDLIDEILLPQIRRLEHLIYLILKDGGFMPVGTEILVKTNIQILVEVERVTVPLFKVHFGPPQESSETSNFIEKWTKTNRFRGPYISGDKLAVDVENPREKVIDCLSHGLNGRDIGAHLTPLRNRIKIIKLGKNSQFEEIVTKYLHRNLFG